MAIDRNLYTDKIDTGLKADKDCYNFYYRFKVGTKDVVKTFDFKDKTWDKKERKKQAKKFALNFKDEKVKTIENTNVDFNEDSKLNDVARIFYSTVPNYQSDWGRDLKRRYELHCEHTIGKKKIKDIKKVHIEQFINQMREKSYGKKAKNGCSIATIKKVLKQSLMPVIQYAVDNDVISKVPSYTMPKQDNTKRIVNEAGVKLATLYTVINDLYKDNPFYRALFLFALYGRRWNEIRTILWSDINFENNIYTIRAENNKIAENQSYDLALPIKEALLQIEDDTKGLVFKSPVTGKELYPPKKQLAHIKDKSNISELTMHYFRHILVSAMGEVGTANSILSASLGHTNLQTVNDYYLTVNHTKATKETNLLIDGIIKVK